MNFDSYITSETKTAISLPLTCPPPYGIKGFERFENLKKKAFTLAETLITLTIIGVVAALTIPTLMSNYQKQTYVIGLKKAYSELQNAIQMVPITEGCPAGDLDCTGLFDEYGNATDIDGQSFNGDSDKKRIYLLSKQFKVMNYYRDNTKCDLVYNALRQDCFQTNNGIIITGGSTIGVDINGDKGPNKPGHDIFMFELALYEHNGVQKGSLLPWGSKIYSDYYQDNSYWYWKNRCTTENLRNSDWEAPYCTGRVLEEGAMNY